MIYCGKLLHIVRRLGIEIIECDVLPVNTDTLCVFTDRCLIFVSPDAPLSKIEDAIKAMEKMADKPCETSDSWRPESSR
nr:MAG TPA: hypothetical protein [Caudoviricetes sp.]